MAKSLEERKIELQQAEQDADLARTWYRFGVEFPQYSLDANRGILIDYHHGEPVTIKSLKECMKDQELVARLALIGDDLAARRAADLRKDTLAEIESLLDGGIPATTKKDDRRRTLDNMLAQARWKDQLELDVWLEELKARKAFRQADNKVLKQVVNQNNPQYGFPPLTGLNLNRDYLISLSAAELRAVIARHGIESVNKVLKGESNDD